jgi:hypothetical protein
VDSWSYGVVRLIRRVDSPHFRVRCRYKHVLIYADCLIFRASLIFLHAFDFQRFTPVE